MKLELIAQVCHEANRALCIQQGDFSQKPWDEAEEWQKESATNGVKYAIANPAITAEDLHNEWMRSKINDGWVYGEKKNVERKFHPCLVSYQKLPEDQKKKDRVFRSIVNLLKDV